MSSMLRALQMSPAENTAVDYWLLIDGSHDLDVSNVARRKKNRAAKPLTGAVMWPRESEPKKQLCFECKGCHRLAVARGCIQKGGPDFCSLLCKVRIWPCAGLVQRLLPFGTETTFLTSSHFLPELVVFDCYHRRGVIRLLSQARRNTVAQESHLLPRVMSRTFSLVASPDKAILFLTISKLALIVTTWPYTLDTLSCDCATLCGKDSIIVISASCKERLLSGWCLPLQETGGTSLHADTLTMRSDEPRIALLYISFLNPIRCLICLSPFPGPGDARPEHGPQCDC